MLAAGTRLALLVAPLIGVMATGVGRAAPQAEPPLQQAPQFAGAARADLEPHYRKSHPRPLRWDVLERWPRVLARPLPAAEASFAPAPHLDEWVFRLPAGSWLRLRGPADADCLPQVHILVGNGSGMFVDAARICSEDGRDVLVPDLRGSERVFRVRDLRVQREPLKFLASRLEPALAMAPARDPVSLHAPLARVSADNGRHRRFATLSPRHGALAEVSGPGRLELLTRRYHPYGEGVAPAWPPRRDCAPGEPQQGTVRALDKPRNVDHYRLQLRFEPLQPQAGRRQPRCLPGRCRIAGPGWRETLDFDTTPEYAHPVRVNGCVVPTGQLETRYVDVPPGDFRIHLDSTSPVLLRAEALAMRDWLLPGLNGPHPHATTIRDRQRWRHASSPWRALRTLDHLDAAERLRRNNARSEGALNAIRWLQVAAQQDPSAAKLTATAAEIRRRHSYLRDLAPAELPNNARQAYALPLPESLVSLDARRRRLHVHKLQMDALLAGYGPVLFTELGLPCARAETESSCCDQCPGTAQTLGFVLPRRSAWSELQILADLRRIHRPVSLWVQLDDEPPRSIALYPAAESEPLGSLPSAPVAAIALLAGDGDPLAGWGRLGAEAESLPRLVPATLDLALSPDVRRLRLWTEDPDAAGLRLAVRYRVAKTEQLAGGEYLEALSRLSQSERLPQYLGLLRGTPARAHDTWFVIVDRSSDPEEALDAAAAIRRSGVPARLILQLRVDDSRIWQIEAGPFSGRSQALDWAARRPASAAFPELRPGGLAAGIEALTAHAGEEGAGGLAQHWLPGLRLVADRISRFSAPVVPSPLNAATRAGVQAARRALDRGDPLAALIALDDGPGQASLLDTMQTRVAAVSAAGEFFIAERMLRGLVLHATERALRDWARDELIGIYRRTGNAVALQGLHASLMLADSGREAWHARYLVEQLIEDGEHEAGLWLGLLLPPCHQPLESLVQVSYLRRHWSLFETLIQSLPSTRRAHWLGYRHLLEGNAAAARTAWTVSGSAGLVHHLDLGHQIGRRLAASANGERGRVLDAWRDWQRSTPGPQAWGRADLAVAGHAGVLQSEIEARQLSVYGYRATARRPLALELDGPIAVRLELRPLHRGAKPLDGWIDIVHNDEHKVLPVFHNRAVAGWSVMQDSPPGIGQPEVSVIELPPGDHRLTISSKDFDLMVRVQTLQPVLPLPLLPPWDAPQRARALRGDWQLTRPADRDHNRRPRVARLDACRVRRLPALPLAVDPDPPSDRVGCGPCATAPMSLKTTLPASAWRRVPVAVRAIRPDASDATPGRRRAAMIQAAWLAEDATQRLAAAGVAEYLARTGPALPDESAIMGRLRRNLAWDRVDTVTSTPGTVRREIRGWNPDSPDLALRRALIGTPPADRHVLRPGDRLRLSLRRQQDITLDLQLERLEIPWIAPAPVELAVQLDDGPVRRVRFDEGRHALALPLAPGEHVLSIRFVDGYANQFVGLRLTDRTSGVVIRPESRREYLLTTTAEPVIWELTGPALVGIERRVDGRAMTEYRRLPSGPGRLVIAPLAGQQEALVRLRRLVLAPAPRRPTPIRQTALNLATLPALGSAPESARVGRLRLLDRYEPGGQEDGTWSAALRWRSLSVDEESGQSAGRDEAYETAAIYRHHYDGVGLDLKLESLWRYRADGADTAGARGGVDWYPDASPWSIGGTLALYRQSLTQTLWGGSARLRVGRPWQWNDYWTTRISAQWIQRWTETPRPGPAETIDRDVFSRYLEQHPRAVTVGLNASYHPWLDSQMDAGMTLIGNESFRQNDLDQWRVNLGWRQLLGDFDLQLQARWQELMNDADRPGRDTRRTLLASIGYDRWWSGSCRGAARLTWRVDPDLGDHSVIAGIEFSGASGRLYKDFRSGEVPFKRLRQWHALGRVSNNAVEETSADGQ